jgi:Na+/H+ antiporter NhaB
LACILMRALFVSTFLALAITAICYTVLLATVTIYFFIVSSRTLKQLNKSTGTAGQARRQKLRNVRAFFNVTSSISIVTDAISLSQTKYR